MKNKAMRQLSFLLIMVMIISLLPLNSLAVPTTIPAATAEGDYYGPNGKFLAPIEAPDPNAIKIYTAEDLNNVRNNLSGSYVLMNPIDLTEWGEWEPIGNESEGYYDVQEGFVYPNSFSGIFDGQGYVIRNLTITGDTYMHVGMFGLVYNGTIQNVGLEDININVSSSSAGGVCGNNEGDTIRSGYIYNCYIAGNISSSNLRINLSVGGICGSKSNGGYISNCYNVGNVSSTLSFLPSFSSNYVYSSRVGGICGYVYGSNLNPIRILNCYNTGDISSASTYSESVSYAGGICGGGGFPGYPSYISDCYNSGGVFSSGDSLSSEAGGIYGSGYDIISNCYNIGSISANSSTSASAGGICGYTGASISNCVGLSSRIYAKGTTYISSYLIGRYATKTNNLAWFTSQGNANLDATRLISLDQAKIQATYETLGWNFEDIWEMVPGYDYPQFKRAPVKPNYPFTVQVISSSSSGVKFNGQNTLTSAFQVRANEEDLILTNTQGLRLAYDNSILQLIKWDASAAIAEPSAGGIFGESVAGAGEGGVLGNSISVFNAISADKNTGYLSLAVGNSVSTFACPLDEFVTLGEVRFAFRDGKSAADLKDDSIWIMDTDELHALKQTFAVLLNTNQELTYIYGSQMDGTARPDWDNLDKPAITWNLLYGVCISGKISSNNPLNPIRVQLMQDGKVVDNIDIDPTTHSGWALVEQSFCFEDVASGTYDLVISKDVHAKLTLQNIVAGDKDLDLTKDSRPEVQLMRLRCGDISNDGLVNDADLTILWRLGNYNRRATEADNDKCDLNGDGLINDADLTILWLAYNYNRGAIIIPY